MWRLSGVFCVWRNHFETFWVSEITSTKQNLGAMEALRAAGKQDIYIVGFIASKWEWTYTIRRTLEFRGLGACVHLIVCIPTGMGRIYPRYLVCSLGVFFSLDSFRSRQPWLIRAMTVGSATESSVATGEILVTKAAPGVAGEDTSVQKGSPKYLIGKTQEELEEIAIGLGEVRLHFWASCYKPLRYQ